MKLVYSKAEYDIYKSDDGYVVVNNTMDNFAHSHINNYRTAKWVVELSIKHKLPHNMPKYLIISLSRINNDPEYKRKIDELIKAKCRKKDFYYNPQKGRKNGKS